jgi:hypothetical protein
MINQKWDHKKLTRFGNTKGEIKAKFAALTDNDLMSGRNGNEVITKHSKLLV